MGVLLASAEGSMKLTQKEAIARIRAMGMVVRITSYTGWSAEAGKSTREYRVNLPDSLGGCEGTAYYTHDAQDAVDTAAAMLTAARAKREGL
jgi:hypothetical protein